MTRREKVLSHINTNDIGIEIGPSHAPIVTKKDGHQVHIIDHMTREQLIEKYKDHGLQLNNIEEVDFVWKGESYSELTGKKKFYNWVIASHLIEHTPDLISFLNDCDAIMKDDGVISLVIPDKRYCFDHFRPITGLSKIIDGHFNKNTIHTPGTAAEYFLNVVASKGRIAWDSSSKGKYQFVHSLNDALDGIDRTSKKKEYIDIHSWCFTPNSFRLIIHDLHSLGLIPFKEVSFFPTEGCEFYITLGRHGKGIKESRLEMLKIIEAEISRQTSFQRYRAFSKKYWNKVRAKLLK
jgi:hypothetical protein